MRIAVVVVVDTVVVDTVVAVAVPTMRVCVRVAGRPAHSGTRGLQTATARGQRRKKKKKKMMMMMTGTRDVRVQSEMGEMGEWSEWMCVT